MRRIQLPIAASPRNCLIGPHNLDKGLLNEVLGMCRHAGEAQAQRVDRRGKRTIEHLMRPRVTPRGSPDNRVIDLYIGELAHVSVL